MFSIFKEADPETDFFHNLSPPPATQLGTGVDFLSQTTRQASPILPAGVLVNLIAVNQTDRVR
jgi:hypothetical protein